MSLLSIGSVAFDAIETPYGKTDKIIGGACTYIALSASYFVKPVNIVGVVGDDFPTDYIMALNAHGVDTQGVEIRPGEKTFFWSGRYHNNLNSRDTLVTDLNVFASFDPIIPDAYQACDYLMLGNLTPQIQLTTLARMKARPKFVMMDTMNLWIDIALDDLRQIIAKVDCLSINDEEARQLSGEYSLRKAARKIMAMGPNTLIIKKGEHGALLFQGQEVFFAPALPLEDVFDPTGAGDTFAGGFIGYLASTDDISFENMKRALIYGSAMASFCVEKFGTERLMNLTHDQISTRVHEFVKLTGFTV